MTTARGGHVAVHHRAGGDEGLLADLDAGREDRAAADAARPPQDRAAQRRRPGPWRAMVSSFVGHRARPDEHVVLDDGERGDVDVASASRTRSPIAHVVVDEEPRPTTRARADARARARRTGRR